MTIYLKQSTASQEVLLGPFVDSTDGNTAETGLTIANTDIKVFKAGATTLANKNSGGATHISNGNYYAVLDATDTDTLGTGALVVQVAGALAVRHDFIVLSANIYDSLVAGSDLFDVSVTQFAGSAITSASGRPEVNVSHFGGSAGTFSSGIPAVNAAQISGDSTAADNLETAYDDTAGAVPWQGIVDQGTAQSASSTGLVLRAGNTHAADTMIGMTVFAFGSTQGYWQSRLITDNDGSDAITVDTWTVTPSGTITYKVFATGPASSSGTVNANVTQWAGTNVATPDTNGYPKVTLKSGTGTGEVSLSSGVAAANVTQFGGSNGTFSSGRPEVNTTHAAGTAWGSGAITANSIAANAFANAKFADDFLTAAKIHSDVTTELQNGLATASALTTVGNNVSSIKTKTDSLNFTVSGQVDANIQYVNDVAVTGDGQSGTEWGPA